MPFCWVLGFIFLIYLLELYSSRMLPYSDLLLGFRHAEYCSDDLPLWGFVGELHPDKNSDNKNHGIAQPKVIELPIKHPELFESWNSPTKGSFAVWATWYWENTVS